MNLLSNFVTGFDLIPEPCGDLALEFYTPKVEFILSVSGEKNEIDYLYVDLKEKEKVFSGNLDYDQFLCVLKFLENFKRKEEK